MCYLVGTRETVPADLIATDDWIDASEASDRISRPGVPAYICETTTGKVFRVGLACDHAR